MKLVRPTEITDAILTSTDVAENDHAAYNAGTTYAAGDNVIITTGVHKIYESLTSGNTGNYPPDNLTGTTPHWLDTGATNAWKMFDDKTNTQTVNSGGIEIVIEPGRINTIACLNLEASTVEVTMVSDSTTVYTSTKTLQAAVASNWYEYFFEPITTDTTAIFTDLPMYGDGVITITIDNLAVDAACGTFVAGFFQLIGDSLWGASAGVLDYSVKSTDDFGNTTLIKRNNSKTLDIDVFVQPNKINETYKTLRDNIAEIRLWIGDEDYEPTIIYGFMREFNEVLSSPAGTGLSLTLEGLI